MGWKLRAFTLLMLISAGLPGMAQGGSEDAKTWAVTAGAFIPTDGDLCGADTQTGFTISLSHRLSGTDRDAFLGVFRYTRYDATGDQWVQLFSPLVEYRWTQSHPVFLAVALGPVYGKDDAGGHTWSAGYELGVGWQPSSTVALELRWISGTKRGERGVALSAGVRF